VATYQRPDRETYLSLVDHRHKFRTIYDRATRRVLDPESGVDESLVRLISEIAWSLDVLRGQLFRYGSVSSLVVQSWMDLVRQASEFGDQPELLAGLYVEKSSIYKALQEIRIHSLPVT